MRFTRRRERHESFPATRHQFLPGAIQGAANSGDRRDKQVDLSSLDSAHVARIEVNKFCQSLLSHPQGCANAPDIPDEFLKIGRLLSFGFALLAKGIG